eukprot:Stramenopile-MAST_4_protein_1848
MSRKIATRLQQCEQRITERQDPAVAREARDAMDPKALREIGSIGEEVEFEWLCMFFLQGSTHAQSHSGYWLPKIEALENMWCTIDRGIAACLRFLKCNGDRFQPLQRTLQILGWLLKERLTKRTEYYKRTKHTAYKQLEAGWQPIPNRPADSGGDGIALAKDLRKDVESINMMLQKGMYVKARVTQARQFFTPCYWVSLMRNREHRFIGKKKLVINSLCFKTLKFILNAKLIYFVKNKDHVN